jgi:hypothetical protein
MLRSRGHDAETGAPRAGISRRTLLAGTTSLAALGPAAASAQVDRRNAQASWVLKRLNGFDTNGVILLRIFHGYFPLPEHLVLDTSAPPFHFLNFYREYDDDAKDGAVVVARLRDAWRHKLMSWVLGVEPKQRFLRFGLVIERRNHGPLAPGRPDTYSAVISDKTDFVCAVGPVESLWEPMVDAYARLPKQPAAR